MSFPQGDYPKPPMTRGIRIGEIGHYTNVDQFDFFKDWINWVNNNNCNVRFDTDGTTILWYWNIKLPLGSYLYADETLMVLTEDELRWHFAPLDKFPADLDSLFQPVTPLAAETGETATETTETTTDAVDGLDPNKDV